MKIAVVAPSPVPFVLGGAERLSRGLTEAINTLTTHDAELIKLPSREHNLPDLMGSYRAFSRLDLSHFDVVISTKYPSWMVDHPRHVVYMLHTLRGLYDTYSQNLPVFPPLESNEPTIDRLVAEATGPRRGRHADLVLLERWDACLEALGRAHPAFAFPGPLARLLVHRLDSISLSPDRMNGHFAISETVARRAGYFPAGVTPRSVIPPTDLRGLRGGEYQGFFTAGRLDGPKRIDLLVRAMRHVTTDTTLTIAGTGPLAGDLQQLAASDPRITFIGHVTDDELVTHYANALAVPFVPLDEDLGYITLEAFLSATPVVTCEDSGGPTELVIAGQTGLVTAPDPAALGAALQRLAVDPDSARIMGQAGKEYAERITWARVIAQLLGKPSLQRAVNASTDRRPTGQGARPHVVTLSTYPAVPTIHGGQVRVYNLHGALAKRCNVDYIGLDLGGPSGTTQPIHGFAQTVVRRTAGFHDYEGALARRLCIPATDIAAALGWQLMPEIIRTIRRATRRADLVILAHPYLLPALKSIAPEVPFVYEAHNAEFQMKAALLGPSGLATESISAVEEVERRAVRGAELVIACSEADQVALDQLGPTLADWSIVPNGADVVGASFTTADQRRVGRDRWLARYSAATGTRGLQHIALFVASYHPPNLAAAETIVALACDAPDVLFVLAGGHASHFADWRLPSNVLARGYVPRPELDRLLAIADVALNPMESGGGSNLKLVEYFAAGVPVVSSEFGARGFSVVHGEHLIIADRAGLSAAVRETLTDPFAEERSKRARALAEVRYDWSVLTPMFVDAIERALRSAGRSVALVT